MAVFGAFFATFVVERGNAPEIFDIARKTLHLGIGLTNTLVLLTSSILVVLALGALRAGARDTARSAVIGAMLCGGAFIALKVYEYYSLVTAGHGVGENHFYLYYFVLTSVQLFHVCVGMAIPVFLLTQTRRNELGENRMAVVEGGACFWHLVDLLWIALFPLLYLVA
ncbi:cytochrome c oxidase subunit 3 [Mycobacterium seoulense]|uniref:cytochrome c oxidase subunit 3 n=1 Tax=Mycobacterium seoulense TaxID=386911 RepID=UPI003CED852B